MKLRNIKRVYHNKQTTVEALKGVNLDFNTNGFITILGPSGCGKTTLLNIISGEDKNFDGEIFDVANITYLTQEIHLFESMSVIDNLKIVHSNLEEIEDYLHQYGLFEHKDKKVKKCSNGQKKRIQFIRALLDKPELILCDEPTAALDHDNAIMLMEALKEISKNVQVIVVTHDIALAHKYADRIIQMGKGVVESDIQFNELPPLELNGRDNKKTLKDVIKLIALEVKSRRSENILFVSMSLLLVLAVVTTINLYQNIQEQSSYLGVFKSGENIIASYPKNMYLKVDEWGETYLDFDFVSYQDIKNIIQTNENILAVEAFYDESNYQENFDVMIQRRKKENNTYYKGTYQLYYPLQMEENIVYDQNDLKFGFTSVDFLNKPLQNGYLIGTKLNDLIKKHELENKKYQFETFSKEREILSYGNESLRLKYGIHLFELMENKNIPILYGTLPLTSKEIVLAHDTAQMLLKQNKYSRLEELIGEKIYIGIESNSTNNVSQYVSACPLVGGDNCTYYSKEGMNYVDRFEYIISGITNIENDHLNIVFTRNEFGKNQILQHYVKNYENLDFDYVRFILEPGSDTETFIQEVNNSFEFNKSEMIIHNTRYDEEVPSYKSESAFFLYCVCILGLFSSLIIIVYIFNIKRMCKEQNIMNAYGYQIHLESILRIVILNLIAFVCFILNYRWLFEIVNRFSKVFGYEKLLSFDFVLIFLSFLVVVIFEIFCERLFGVRKHD